MKNIRILRKNIRDGVKNIIRNFSLSLASISCITVTLLIVAFAIVGSYNVENFTKVIRDDFTIVVYMNNSNTEETEAKIKEVKEQLNVAKASADKLSKEFSAAKSDAAMARLQKRWKSKNPVKELKDLINKNFSFFMKNKIIKSFLQESGY